MINTQEKQQKFQSFPESPITNGQEPGIGRVAFIGGFLVVNNLGRNLSVLKYSSGDLNLVATFAETACANGSKESEFDLDTHAFLRSSRGDIVEINHFGNVKVFMGMFSPRNKTMKPFQQFKLPGDVERFVMANDCLIGSSPCGYEVPDAARSGILITAPIYDSQEFDLLFEDWGTVNNVAVNESKTKLAIAAAGRLGIFEIRSSEAGVKLGNQLREVETSFLPQLCMFQNENLVIAGPEPSAAGDQEWDLLGEGGFAIVDCEKGEFICRYNFDENLAWGNGGTPAVAHRRMLYGVNRRGAAFSWVLSTGQKTEASPPMVPEGLSLGIGHATFDGLSLWAGFNRGNYFIHRYSV
jgi:hypothetical protein